MISRICMWAAIFALLGAAGVRGQATFISGPIFDGPGSIGPLNGVFVVNGPLSVPAGETLTLGPNCVLKFEVLIPRLSFVIDGNLVVDGTGGSIRPTFTSVRDDTVGGVQDVSGTDPAPGDWTTIQVNGGGSLDLTRCDIRFASSSIRKGGAGALAPGGIQLNDVNITDGVFDALDCGGSECSLQDVNIARHGGIGVADMDARFTSQINNLVITDCGGGNIVDTDFSNVDSAVTITTANTANGLGAIVSLFGRPIEVAPAGHLTLEAGVVIKGGNNVVNVDGTLTCNGTAASPVVFTSFNDDSFGGDSNNDGNAPPPPGFTIRSIAFRAGSDASVLNHTKIFTTQADSVRISNSSPTIRDCEIANAPGDGITRLGPIGASLPTIERTLVRDCGGVAMSGFHVIALPNLRDNQAFGNAGGDHLAAVLTNGLLGAGTVTIGPRNFLNGEVRLGANISFDHIENGDRLRILDGSIIKFSLGGGLRAGTGGAIDVLGTAARPVIMTNDADDEVGIDTLNDGPVSGPRWRGISYLTNAAPSRCEFLKIRLSRLPCFQSSSVNLTTRSVEVRATPESGQAAVEFINLAGPADNFIVDVPGALRQIRLRNGVVLRHATVVNGSNNGVEAVNGWTGTVENCISFNHAGANYANIPAAQVFNSLGDFAGTNGNIVADPQLVDAANGDYRLAAGSPAINAAGLAVGGAVGTDHDENPRVLSETPGGTVLPDMGALEHITHVLTLSGTGQIGQGLNVNAVGPDLVTTLYAIGLPDVPFVIPPFGTLLIGPVNDLIVNVLPAGQARFLFIPDSEALIGFEFAFQALVNVTTSADDQLTNMVRVRIN